MSAWSADVCTSVLVAGVDAGAEPDRRGGSQPGGDLPQYRWPPGGRGVRREGDPRGADARSRDLGGRCDRGRVRRGEGRVPRLLQDGAVLRSEEHTSELQSLMRISYAVFCLKKKKTNIKIN